MKSASSSSNEIPPAVEIARAIGAVPLSLIGTALIKPARLAGDNDDSETPDAIAASCSRPMADRRQMRGLAQTIGERLLASRRGQPRSQFDSMSRSGRNATCNVASPVAMIASRKSADSA